MNQRNLQFDHRATFYRTSHFALHTSHLSQAGRLCYGRHGFTLIELLVVISIISLLVSILLPSLSKAKALAQTTVCSSNLRQIGIATRMYADDYEEKMPCYIYPGLEVTQANINPNRWFNTLINMPKGIGNGVDYLSVNTTTKQGVLYCPAETNITESYNGVTYAMNISCMFYNSARLYRKIDESTGPLDKVVYLLDSLQSCPSINTYASSAASREYEVMHDPSYRHNEGLNILFQDMHVDRIDDTLEYYPPNTNPDTNYCWY